MVNETAPIWGKQGEWTLYNQYNSDYFGGLEPLEYFELEQTLVKILCNKEDYNDIEAALKGAIAFRLDAKRLSMFIESQFCKNMIKWMTELVKEK